MPKNYSLAKNISNPSRCQFEPLGCGSYLKINYRLGRKVGN